MIINLKKNKTMVVNHNTCKTMEWADVLADFTIEFKNALFQVWG